MNRSQPQGPTPRQLCRRRAAVAVLAALATAGCANPAQMSAKQREGVELRRYCEQHPEEVEKCVGFLGWR